jgi:hypothetical protein
MRIGAGVCSNGVERGDPQSILAQTHRAGVKLKKRKKIYFKLADTH